MPPKGDIVMVPCSAVAVVVTVPSESVAENEMETVPPSSTVFVDSSVSVGASFSALTVIAVVLIVVAPSLSVAVTVSVSEPV